jgi:Tfp pilus assembly major pilin PilA
MRLLAFTVAAMIALSLTALAAAAVDPAQTRESYVAQADPICKVNTEANSKILKGVRQLVRDDKLKPAAGKFSKAAAALRKTLGQLRAVPQPPADVARLGRWLKLIGEEADLLQTTSTKLRKGDKFGAQKMAVRLTQTANRANNEVLGFEFRYCDANPSQFT